MRHLLPRRNNPLARHRAVLSAWLLALACLGGQHALAQTATTNELPPVANSAAEPDAQPNTWAIHAAVAVRDGRHDGALPWIQRLLQADPAAMVSTNGVTFRPARKLARELIRTVPVHALAAYRAQIDISKGMPSRPPAPTDLAALEARYQNAFASDHAETGFRLAGGYLDQGRFKEARRVLLDLLDSGAATRTPRSELLARLVVACARVGDFAEAERASAELQKEGDTSRWPGVEGELRARAASAPVSNAWTMAYGGPSREGTTTPAAPDLGTNGAWILRWGLNLGSGLVREGLSGKGPTNLPPQLSLGRAYAAACMMEQNQRPSDDLIFAGNRVWINGFAECVAVDLDTGRAVQRTAHLPSDPPPKVPVTYGAWVFGNRLNRSASLIGNRVYCVEDNSRSSISQDARERIESVDRKPVAQPLPCGNILAAYAAAVGSADRAQVHWRLAQYRERTGNTDGALTLYAAN